MRENSLNKMVERNLVCCSSTVSGKETCIGDTCVFVCAVRYIFAWKLYGRIHVGVRVGALTRDRQARIYQGGARGSTDQSEASILYPPDYLGRMPHVRGVVWGHPCSNICRFSPVIEFSMLAASHIPPCQHLASISTTRRSYTFTDFSVIIEFLRKRKRQIKNILRFNYFVHLMEIVDTAGSQYRETNKS